MDKQEEFRLRFNSLHKIGVNLLDEKEDKLRFALCQAEIVKASSKATELINNLSEKEYDFSAESLDKLLEELVQIRLYLFYEMVPWMRKLRMPLDKAINEVEHQLNKIEDEEER